MKIGILQTGRSPEELRNKHGDYDDMFCQFLGGRGFEFVTYPVLDGLNPKSVRDADGWLITGSKFGVYENHSWIPPLEDFLRRAYAEAVPMVGVCFGHQLIAQALGGKVKKYPGGWSVGPEVYELDGISGKACVMAWHQDQVIEKPEVAVTAGSSAFCKFAALSYGDRAFTIQPHPEFKAEFVADLVVARRNILPDNLAEKTLAGLDKALSSAAIADLIDAFFRKPRG